MCHYKVRKAATKLFKSDVRRVTSMIDEALNSHEHKIRDLEEHAEDRERTLSKYVIYGRKITEENKRLKTVASDLLSANAEILKTNTSLEKRLFEKDTDIRRLNSVIESLKRLREGTVTQVNRERSAKEEARSEIESLKGELRIASSESVSDRCHRTGNQCCHCCEDMSCGDNISDFAKEFKRLKKTEKDIDAYSQIDYIE